MSGRTKPDKLKAFRRARVSAEVVAFDKRWLKVSTLFVIG